MKNSLRIGTLELGVVDSYNYGVFRKLIVKEGKMKGCEYTAESYFYPTLELAAACMAEKLEDDCIATKELSNFDVLKKLPNDLKEVREDFLKKLKEVL